MFWVSQRLEVRVADSVWQVIPVIATSVSCPTKGSWQNRLILWCRCELQPLNVLPKHVKADISSLYLVSRLFTSPYHTSLNVK